MLNLKFLFILFLIALRNGQQNITVDNSSSSVIYTPRGNWNIISDLIDIGGTHKVTTNPVTSASVFRHFSFHKFHKLLKLGHSKNLKNTGNISAWEPTSLFVETWWQGLALLSPALICPYKM